MLSSKKLMKMGRKWQNLAVLMHKTTAFTTCTNRKNRGIDKGQFAVYTCDEIRFLMPLGYLKNDIFQEVLEVAEDEYGLHNGGPIRLPFESTCMNYMISLIERHVCKEHGKTVLMSIASRGCLPDSDSKVEQSRTELLISSF